MYVKFTEEELLGFRQYWYSKAVNEPCMPEKNIFYDLYRAYDNLINHPYLETKDEQSN